MEYLCLLDLLLELEKKKMYQLRVLKLGAQLPHAA